MDLSNFGERLKKYRIENNALVDAVKNDPSERVEFEIGDTKQVNFFPQIKVKKWDNEQNVSIRFLGDISASDLIVENEKVKLISSKKEVHIYRTMSDFEEDVYELEVILNEKPDVNYLNFSLQTKDVEFYYQPKLTQKELDSGMQRPDHVVGSYAIYASNLKSGDYSKIGGKNYRSGKVGHIYRPKIEDSSNNWTWGELSIFENLLTVTIPQSFLDNAVYPVRHAAGLTFGYTSQGASDLQISSSSADSHAAQFGSSISGTLTDVSAYVKRNSSNANIQLEIWSHLVTIPNARLDGSSDIAVTSASYSLKSASISESLSGDYWAVVQGIYGGPGTQTYVAYDSGSGSGAKTNDLGVWSADSNRYSVYATYTESGGSSLSVSDTVSITESIIALIPTLFISLFDSVSVSESLQTEQSVLFSINDSISVTENVFISTIASIDLSDSVTVSESLLISYSIPSPIFDSVSVSESIQIDSKIGAYSQDIITATEDIEINVTSYIDVSDQITVTESISISIIDASGIEISIFDSITVSESLQVDYSIHILSTDDVSIIDDISIFSTTENVLAYDIISILESVTLYVPMSVSVFDDIPVTEYFSQNTVDIVLISVSDNVVVSEIYSSEIRTYGYNTNEYRPIGSIISQGMFGDAD